MCRAANAPSLSLVLGRRFLIVAGLAAALVSCGTVGNRITGVKLGRAQPTTCIRNCNELYNGLIARESKMREQNLELCRQLSQPQLGTCLMEEGERHAAEMTRLEQAKADCLSSCTRDAPG